jgi:hypothetical protein
MYPGIRAVAVLNRPTQVASSSYCVNEDQDCISRTPRGSSAPRKDFAGRDIVLRRSILGSAAKQEKPDFVGVISHPHQYCGKDGVLGEQVDTVAVHLLTKHHYSAFIEKKKSTLDRNLPKQQTGQKLSIFDRTLLSPIQTSWIFESNPSARSCPVRWRTTCAPPGCIDPAQASLQCSTPWARCNCRSRKFS